jgi:hypothetical protein
VVVIQHRAGHCVTCDAALKDHVARSIGPPGESDRFWIGPPPSRCSRMIFRFPFASMALFMAATALGAGAAAWMLLR